LEMILRNRLVTQQEVIFTTFCTETVEETKTRVTAACLDFDFLLVPVGDQFKGLLHDRTRTRAVSFPDQAFALHLIQQGGGPPIADAQAALQDGGRSALHIDANA